MLAVGFGLLLLGWAFAFIGLFTFLHAHDPSTLLLVANAIEPFVLALAVAAVLAVPVAAVWLFVRNFPLSALPPDSKDDTMNPQ